MMNFPLTQWIRQRLIRQLITVMSVSLIITFILMVVLFQQVYHRQLFKEYHTVSHQVKHWFQILLASMMSQHHDLTGLRLFLDAIGQYQELRNVFLLNAARKIRLASKANLVSTSVTNLPLLPMLATDFAAKLKKTTALVTNFSNPWLFDEVYPQVITNEWGEEVVRTIVPLYQAAPCTDCHGSHQENSVEDMVFLDYDAGVLRERAWQNGWYWFMGGVLVFVIMTTTIVWFVYRFVLIPLHHLIGATGGQLTSKVGENEFGILAQKLLEPVNSEKHFLQALFDAIPDGIRVIAPNHAVIMANQAYYHQLGLASHQTINQPCYVTTYARQRPCSAALIACPMQEVLKTGKGVKILTQHQHAEGTLLPVEVCAAPLQVEYKGQTETFVVESIRELTLTPHFSHEMKLASVGQLAANVAHDIKSPLSSIRLVLQSSLRDLNSSQANLTNIANSLALVDQQIDKCLAITQRLLTLASPADESSQLLALNEIIGETLALLAVEAKERGIRIRTHFQRNNHYLLANEHDIRMLILNLLQNAFNAMPSGGEIDITIQPHLGQIQLTIQDTGVGIHPTMIEKIFDPFFSHRVDGKKSSGLGLAICKSIVERYQGHIEVNSHIQRGSQFLITLPAAQVST